MDNANSNLFIKKFFILVISTNLTLVHSIPYSISLQQCSQAIICKCIRHCLCLSQ